MVDSYLRSLIILFFIIHAALCFGQDSDSNLGIDLANKGEAFYFSNELDSAIFYTKKASVFFEEEKDWESYVIVSNGLAAMYYLNKTFGPELKENLFKAYNAAIDHLPDTIRPYITAVSNVSTHYYSLGKYSESIDVLKKALALNIKNKASSKEIVTNYQNIGNSYRYLGDNQNAFNFLNKAKKLELKTNPNDPSIAITYSSIAILFQLENQIDSAIYYHEKGEQLLKPLSSSSIYSRKKFDNLLLLAELWNQKGDTQKSNAYIDDIKNLKPNEFYQILLFETLGKINIFNKKYDEAVRVLKEGQAIADKHDKRNIPSMKSRRLINLGDAYFSLADYNSALTIYQEILNTLSPNFNSLHHSNNPKANEIFEKITALAALNGKAKTLQELYAQTKDGSYLNAAYSTYLVATQLIRNMRQGFLNIEAKNALAEKSVEIYEGSIQSALELYQQSKEEKYKSSALTLAESNKALLLLESINEQTAKGFAGIPDSLLEKEKDLNLNIAYLQKKIVGKANNIKNIKDQIFDLQQQSQQLSSQLEKNYPRYFQLKYQNEAVDLKTIQQELNNQNSALLEYFVGENSIYLFVATATTLDVKVIAQTDQLSKNIQQLRTALNTSPGTLDAKTEFNQFTMAAHDLYTLLLEPALTTLPNNISNLTIIPDYQLNYIPFDVLLSSPANPDQPGYSTASLDYLMEKYTINYHYSATLLHKNKQRKKQDFEHDFIGYAPTFKDSRAISSRACTSDELYSLQCSANEIQSISDLLNGTALSGEQANKQNFEAASGAYRIIHMATHACIDESNSKINKIFLTDDYLSNFDLYNMDLNAELAVLSACNTGSGELVKGEGVMSLARGFINAGCSSTLMSMWSVDDCATSDIMIRVYDGLKKGSKKDVALREAKLNYLDSASKAKTHPYYWAAFVQFGDVGAMDLGTSFSWKYLVLIFGGLVGLFLLLWRGRSLG